MNESRMIDEFHVPLSIVNREWRTRPTVMNQRCSAVDSIATSLLLLLGFGCTLSVPFKARTSLSEHTHIYIYSCVCVCVF